MKITNRKIKITNLKNAKTVLVCGFFAVLSALFSSCIVLVDDSDFPENETPCVREENARIFVQNNASKFGSDACYISDVYCRTSEYSEWIPVWENPASSVYSDSNCSFELPEGRYYFCVRAIYPNLSCRYDYYKDYFTDVRYFVSGGRTSFLEFDGDCVCKNF